MEETNTPGSLGAVGGVGRGESELEASLTSWQSCDSVGNTPLAD